ncbi:MAG: 3-phosphoshikimate 1-carboxyvinyltransferase [Anaerolineae bacterium]
MRVLRVQPGGPLRGTASLPGDKSISHRALLLSAIADATTEFRNLSPCGDVASTMAALRQLGVVIEGSGGTDGDRVLVHGRGMFGLGGPPVEIDCGESGTTMRLLCGLLAGQARSFVLSGSAALRRRPMERVVAPLRSMGARVEASSGHAPLRGSGGAPLHARRIELERASAQVGGAVLLAGLLADGTTEVVYPSPVRDHTERMLADMGVAVRWSPSGSALVGPVPRLSPWSGGDGAVPGDVSAAAFLLTAAALTPGSSVRLDGVGINPGRTGFLEVLALAGAAPDEANYALSGGETTATLAIAGPAPGALRAVELGEAGAPSASRAIDELPLLAVLATQAGGRTSVRGAAELRVKECDRIAATVEGLSRMGAQIEEHADGFSVTGPTRLSGALVDGHGDHRIVMALAVAGLVAGGETIVTDAERVSDSFPGFVAALRELGAGVTEEEG